MSEGGDDGIVEIHYARPGRGGTIYLQWIVESTAEVVVTFQPDTPITRPMTIDGETVLENHSPVVWFTYPGLWHDIGLFHRRDGTPTGLYANVLTPVAMPTPNYWETTDLFLDVWVPRSGDRPRVLDASELADATARGWVSEETAACATAEAEKLILAQADGSWPPAHVAAWDLERVRTCLNER